MNYSKNFKRRIQILLFVLVLLGLLAVTTIGSMGLLASRNLTNSIDALGQNSLLLTEGNLGLSNTIAAFLDRQESIASANDLDSLQQVPDKTPLESAFEDQFETLATKLTGWPKEDSDTFFNSFTEFTDQDSELITKKETLIETEQILEDQAFEIQSISARIKINADTLANLVASYKEDGDKKKGKGLFWGMSSQRREAKEISDLLVDKNNDTDNKKSIISLYVSGLERATQKVLLASDENDIDFIQHDQLKTIREELSTMLKDLADSNVDIENFQVLTQQMQGDFNNLIALLESDQGSLINNKKQLLIEQQNFAKLQKTLESSRNSLLEHLEALSKSGDQLAKRTKSRADAVAKRTQNLIVAIGAIVLLIFMLFGNAIARRIRVMAETIEAHSVEMEKANAIIQEAHEDLQEANSFITESINYASHIQQSILPPPNALNSCTQDHFVLWQPKDIVGGDIYWCRPWGNGYLIILADCTGHGVPGALMTILTKAAVDNALLKVIPGNVSELVNSVHQHIQAELRQDSASTANQTTGSNDGLDLGVCYFDNTTLTYCGARQSLLCIDHNNHMEEYRGNKQSIGYRDIPFELTFTEHQIPLAELKSCYLISDGYIDQIGGEKAISFGKKRLYKALESWTEQPMEQQYEAFVQTLAEYQGDQERRDDVTVIGFAPLASIATDQPHSSQSEEHNAGHSGR